MALSLYSRERKMVPCLEKSMDILLYASFLYKKNENGEDTKTMYGFYMVLFQKDTPIRSLTKMGPKVKSIFIEEINKLVNDLNNTIKKTKTAISAKNKIACSLCSTLIAGACIQVETNVSKVYFHLSCDSQVAKRVPLYLFVHDWDLEDFDPKVFQKEFSKVEFISTQCFFKDSKNFLPGSLSSITQIMDSSEFEPYPLPMEYSAIKKFLDLKIELDDKILDKFSKDALFTKNPHLVENYPPEMTVQKFLEVRLESRCLLLAAVFQRFRKFILSHSELNLTKCSSIIGYSMLRTIAGYEKDLRIGCELKDENIQNMFKSGTNFDQKFLAPKEIASRNTIAFTLCLNMENIYPWISSQLFPNGNYHQPNLSLENVLITPDDFPIGFIVDLDVDYSDKFDFILDKDSIIPGWKRRCFHYRLLKLLVNQGLVTGKIYRIIGFSQYNPWEKYFRNSFVKCDNSFDSELMSLINSAVFALTPEYHKSSVFQDCKNLELNLGESRVKDYFTSVRFMFSQLSMFLKYDFWYNFLKKKYGENATMISSFGNIMMITIDTENVYNDLSRDNEWIDFDNFPSCSDFRGSLDSLERPLRFSDQMKKVKDETEGCQIMECVFGEKNVEIKCKTFTLTYPW
jgi:hypothetical protein